MPWEVMRGDKLYKKSPSRKRDITTLVYIDFAKKPGGASGLERFEFDVKSYEIPKNPANPNYPTDDDIAAVITSLNNRNVPANLIGPTSITGSPLALTLLTGKIHEIIFYLAVENWKFQPPAFEFKLDDANETNKYGRFHRFWGLRWFSHRTLLDLNNNRRYNGGIRLHYDCRKYRGQNHKVDYAFNLLINIFQSGGKTPIIIDPIIRNDP